MIELAVTQNTPEWHAQRAGIPTASAASRLITPTGKPATGDAVEKFMYQLIYERMSDAPIVGFKSFWMERGSEKEAEAVNTFEFTNEVATEPCGFILNDERTAGASPDRKCIGKNEGLEIKAPKPENHLMYLMKSGSAWKDHYPQLQFQLMITGWDAMHLYSYHDDLPPAIIPTEPKRDYIETLTNILGEFNLALEKKYAEIVDMGLARADWRKASEMPVREAVSQSSITDIMRETLIEVNRGR